MKKIKKMHKLVLMSSLAAILAGGVAISSTYALFTSKAETKVTASAGKVSVSSSIELKEAYHPRLINTDGSLANLENDIKNADLNVEIKNSDVSITKMLPGDKVTLTVNITNDSNVKIKYREKYSIEGTDKEKLLVTGTEKMVTNWTSLEANGVIDSYDVTIELPTTETKQIDQVTISLEVEAVQGNASTEKTIVVTPDTSTINIEPNSVIYFKAGKYGMKNYTFYDKENVTFIGDVGANFERLTINSYSSTDSSLANSTLTIKGIGVENILQIDTGDKETIVEKNTAGNISINETIGWDWSFTRCETFTVNNNYITGGITGTPTLEKKDGTQIESTSSVNGIYIDLTTDAKINGNTFDNVYENAIALSVSIENLEIKNNQFNSYGTKGQNCAALKIWNSTTYMPGSKLTEAANVLINSIKCNNNFSEEMLNKLGNGLDNYFLAIISAGNKGIFVRYDFTSITKYE